MTEHRKTKKNKKAAFMPPIFAALAFTCHMVMNTLYNRITMKGLPLA